jgi:hypothetical protein
MNERTLLLLLLALSVIWILELVWLYWMSSRRGMDPIQVTSGAAIFWVFAAPVALLAPDLVDRVGDMWANVVHSIAGGGSAAPQPAPTYARLLIDNEVRPLTQPRVRIGRYPNNDIVLDHGTVSAYHAEIIQRPDGSHELNDQGSRNGSRVNGGLVTQQVLRNGDLVTLGAANFHYLNEPDMAGSQGHYDDPMYDDAEPMDDDPMHYAPPPPASSTDRRQSAPRRTIGGGSGYDDGYGEAPRARRASSYERYAHAQGDDDD